MIDAPLTLSVSQYVPEKRNKKKGEKGRKTIAHA